MDRVISSLRFVVFVLLCLVVGMMYWTFQMVEASRLMKRELNPPVIHELVPPDNTDGPCYDCERWEQHPIEGEVEKPIFPDDMLECESGDHACID